MQTSTAAHRNEFALALGARIKQGRKAAQMTQVVFAERCQIYRSYLTNIEAGKANPSLSVLLSVAAQLGVPLWQLMQIAPLRGWREVVGAKTDECAQIRALETFDAISKSTKQPRTKKKGRSSAV